MTERIKEKINKALDILIDKEVDLSNIFAKDGLLKELTKNLVERALPKFSLLPKRWLVERTFAWLGKFRRLSKDYEFDIKSSIAMIVIALIRNLVKRISKSLL